MQVAIYRYSVGAGGGKSSPEKKGPSAKEAIILSEIGLDQVPTATDFVEYLADKYNWSQSGIWYTLKKLKKGGLLSFTEKGEEYKPLTLTEGGVTTLRNNMSASPARQFCARQVGSANLGL